MLKIKIKMLKICKGILKKLESISALQFIANYLLDHCRIVEQPKYRKTLVGLEILKMLENKDRALYIHLIKELLLMLEQLLMNSKFENIQKILNMLHEVLQHPDIGISNFDKIIRFYAKKSLDFRVSLQRDGTENKARNISQSNLETEDNEFIMPVNVPTKEEWVPNDRARECDCCKAVIFSMFNRRHYCRRCGRVVCAMCSQHRMQVAGYPSSVLVRVCDDCKHQTVLQMRAVQSVPSTSSSELFDYWRLTRDERHNRTIREEFSFEYAPNISLCLAILNLHFDPKIYTSFLLDRCDEMKRLLQPVNGSRINPEVDHAVIIKMIRSPLVAAFASSRLRPQCVCDGYPQYRKMDRAKRNIVKPARFQTTSSDEAPTRRPMDSIRVLNTNIENDINDLRTLADKDPLDLEDCSQNQYSPSVDTVVQSRSNASTCNQYLPPISSSYVTLQPPVHAQYGTYSSQPSSSTNMHQMQPSGSTNMHQMQPSISTNTHTIPYMHDQAHQPRPSQRTEPNPNLTMRINESQYDIDNRNVHGRLDNMETQLKKINNVMEQILKHLQSKDKRRKAPQKPALLPIATVEEMTNFENIDDETYEEVVSYFHHVGGFTAKEAINVAFKEAVKESVAVKYTWFGREEGVHPLYNTRIIMAIYDSVCNNDYFCKPSRAEFQSIAREALRSAKQRHRTSTRILHNRERQAREARNYWGDAAENEPRPNIEEPENEEELRD